MRWVAFYRLFFFILMVFFIRYAGLKSGFTNEVSTLGAVVISLVVFSIEYFISTRRSRDVLAFYVGIALAVIISSILAFIITLLPFMRPASFWVYVAMNLIGIYIFGSFTYHKRHELRILNLFLRPRVTTASCSSKILDTSVLIDGRILGVAKSGFLEGEVLVPRFILKELQRIADSKDHVRRTRGRRGMDVLKEMQKLDSISIHIISDDFPRIKEVDLKLIELAKAKKAKIITTDYNLKKIADIHGIKVLNVNELTFLLKPVIMAGDEIKVKVVKQGKEETQGVGYLDDGTMVVVENGYQFMGRDINCIVVSVLQTEAGRMVFARPKQS
ncbi:MAG: PIN domain-containing protein [Candidatus Hydrothermae bacterium]|nr:PIN domain-containing protein [Candidatus Hydrothermae bacterium]